MIAIRGSRGTRPRNNLRDQYLRAVLLGGQKHPVYRPTDRARIDSAFWKASNTKEIDSDFDSFLNALKEGSMLSKKVVLFLVEGPSDETAIRGPVNLLIQSSFNSDSASFHGDVTTSQIEYPTFYRIKDSIRDTVKTFCRRLLEK